MAISVSRQSDEKRRKEKYADVNALSKCLEFDNWASVSNVSEVPEIDGPDVKRFRRYVDQSGLNVPSSSLFPFVIVGFVIVMRERTCSALSRGSLHARDNTSQAPG